MLNNDIKKLYVTLCTFPHMHQLVYILPLRAAVLAIMTLTELNGLIGFKLVKGRKEKYLNERT